VIIGCGQVKRGVALYRGGGGGGGGDWVEWGGPADERHARGAGGGGGDYVWATGQGLGTQRQTQQGGL